MSILTPEWMPEDAKPIITDNKVSWEHRTHPGDWQMGNKACALFAMASWIEIVWNQPIPDDEVISAYQEYGSITGVEYATAHTIANDRGWFPVKTRGLIGTSMLDTRIKEQPVLAVYNITSSWHYIGNSGIIKSWAGFTNMSGLRRKSKHAVVIIGTHNTHNTQKKKKKKKNKEWVDIENSWGPSWGRNGFAQVLRKVHNTIISRMYVIV